MGQPPISTRPKRLSVSAILFGILAGIVGGTVGLGLGLALGSALAAVLHVSPMEGEAGYFAVAIALIVALIVTPSSILLTLYWRGLRSIWLFIGLITVCLSILVIASAGFGLWYMVQPHILNANGPTPQLEFEIKPPDGHSVDSLTGAEAELDTDRNVMPADWRDSESPGVRAGYVEVYYRTSQRFFVLKFPNHEDRIFRLRLPANPMKSKYRVWSDWQKPDFIAKAGEQPSRTSTGNDYQIRYRLDYQDR